MRDPFPYLSLAATLLLLLLVDPTLAAAALGVLGVVAFALPPKRRETRILACGLLLAAVVLATGVAAARFAASPSWTGRAERRLDELLGRLEARADRARAAAADLDAGSRRVDAFDRLSALARNDDGEWSYLLFDQDGEAVAWSGEGLLHEIDPLLTRQAVTSYVSSYTATTLYALRPVGEGADAWWIAAGRSFPRDRLPFSPGPLLERRAYRWWIERDVAAARGVGTTGGDATADGDPTAGVDATVAAARSRDGGAVAPTASLRSGRGFVMRVAREPGDDLASNAKRVATIALGVALLIAALDGARGVARGEGAGRTLAPAIAGAAGVAALARAGGAGPIPLATLAAALFLGAAWFSLRSGLLAIPRWTTACTLVGAGLPLGLAWVAQRVDATPDLGQHLGASGGALAYRAAILLLALSTLAPIGSAVSPAGMQRSRRASRLLGAGIGVMLAAAALCDHTPFAAALLIIGAAAAIVALEDRGASAAGRWLTAVVLACLLAGVSWEITYRDGVRSRWARELAALSGPALDARALELADETEAFLHSAAAREIVSMPTTAGSARDLAVALWRRSPLARRDVASAVQVDIGTDEPSLFSYGLTIREGEIDPESLPPAGVRASHWIDGGATVVQGGPEEAPAPREGEAGAADSRARRQSQSVLFWIVPLAAPVDRATFEELEVDLLRGRLAVEGAELPGGAALAVHDGKRPLLLPWRRATPPEQAAHGLAHTPDGPAWFWASHHDDTTTTVYLPRLGPLAGLERVGIHAVGTLAAAAVLGALGFLLMLGDDTFRRRVSVALRSYSRRLILILTGLIVVPLLLLDVVLVRALDERLETEHREAAEVALEVAQRVLSDYLLALEPGFGIRAVLEQEVLDWLAQTVDREVNVYWGSQSFASSRPELFTAGLLPARIPGDVFSELALRHDALAARTRTAAGRTYLELYAPLEVAMPDLPLERRFYLSTPLLAQAEAVSDELARLGRRVIVVTVALLLLVLAVGARLAAGFTRPVMEIVGGTDRIARGATSLGLRPSEPELRTLVSAIDEMARRLAQSRADLVREKQVVETMIESITTAVVSVDQDRRVMLHNRAASSMLGVEVGAPIARVAAQAPIEGLEEFLRDADAGADVDAGSTRAPFHRRLRSAGSGDREWSVVWVPVPGGGDPAALLVVEDVTEILRAQRLEAWAEMARIIAHEVKNPLTPIRLSTEHMQQVYAADPAHFGEVFERCTRNILTQVEELRAIASEFGTYSRVTDMDLRPGDVVSLARSITAAYQAAPPPGVEILFESATPSAPARFDERLLTRALRNLLENAVRASRDDGEVSVRVGTDNGTIAIDVTDRGPGVRAEDMARIFEPYFSTYDSGTGLGLPIARRIVEVHGGTISAENRVGGGLAVHIALPLYQVH